MRLASLDATGASDVVVGQSVAKRDTVWSNVLVGGFACATVSGLGLMHGGYFSTAWGWGALGALWIAAVTLLVSDRVWVGPLEVTLVSGLGAFLVFTALSSLWSVSPPAAIREAERGTLILAVVVAAILVTRRRMRPLVAGVMAGIAIAATYGLATRLFPTQLGTFDATAGYRLAEPLGYWNALGVLAAIGALLGLGFAARGRSAWMRGIGSAMPVLLFPAMYFTFGRGVWVALGIGLAGALALDRRRLQLTAAILCLTPFVGLAVWMCSREPDLNRRTAALAGASSEGRRLAFVLIALAAAAAFVGPAMQRAERRLVITRGVRFAYLATVLALGIAGVAVGLARYGAPQDIANRAYDAFRAPPARVSSSENLSQRLFSLSSNGRLDMWRIAVDNYKAHPWLGSGAGTYEYAWLKDRPRSDKVRDAHNLYIEVLSELGPVGLGLLLFAFSIPIVTAFRVRQHPLVPITLGAYVAYLVHAAADWDWEMPAVTLAGLLCGVAILVVGRPEAHGRVLRKRVRVRAVTAIAALAVFAFIGLMGNLAIAASNNAAGNSKWADSARRAREARQWMPWSPDPWRQLGEAQYAEGNFPAARASFRKAISKDRNNWLVWADLAAASTGTEFRAAALAALRLNPLAPELAGFKQELGSAG